MFENMTADTGKDSSKPALTRDEAEQYSSLLENAFVVGYIPKPDRMTASAVPPKPSDHSWNGMFLAYDRTGKEVLLSKAVLRMRGSEKEMPKLSEINVSGVPVLKVERATSTTYWVEHGKYAVSASERSVLEEVLARLEGKSSGTSLAQSDAYKEAQPALGGGVIEFFAHLPNLRSVAPDASAQGVKVGPVLDAMKIDAIHSICGRVTLDGSKTRVQGALLGEAGSGTLFDLWGAGATEKPPSLALVPPNAISYSETQFNFAALYEILMRGARAMFPQGQQDRAAMIDALAQSRLGMPLPEALGLMSGEFASIQLSPSMDPQKSVHILGIHKKPETLKLLHTLFSDQLTGERNEGDTTFLKVSLGGGQGGAGVAQWNFYHLAITPQFILMSGRAETLHDLLAQRATPGSVSTVPASYQTARAAYPGKVDGLNYFDFHGVDWAALKDRWVQEAKKANAKQIAGGSQKAVSTKVPDLLTNVNPQVFPKHLHFMAGASWKDAKGIHFDQWIE